MGGHPHPDPAPADEVWVQVLHGFKVVARGRRVQLSEAGEQVVAFLALAGVSQTRPLVAGSLWPDQPRDEGLARLRRVLWGLRRSAPGLVHTLGGSIELGPDVTLDLSEVQRIADTVGIEPQPVSYRIVRLLAADLLPDWSFDWLDVHREWLRYMRLHTLEGLARHELAAGRPQEALVAAMAAARVDPLRESGQRLVLAAHLAEGNVVEAIRSFARYRDLLWAELGLRPSRELQRMLPESERHSRHIPGQRPARLSPAG